MTYSETESLIAGEGGQANSFQESGCLKGSVLRECNASVRCIEEDFDIIGENVEFSEKSIATDSNGLFIGN